MNIDNTNGSGPSVKREILLKYVLDQVDETARRRFRLGLPLQILGYVALHHDKALLEEYERVHLPHNSPFHRLRGYQRLFAEALTRLENTPVEETAPSMSEDPPVFEGFSNEFIATARRDGSEMLNRHDFRFVAVFLILAWIGLRHDTELLSDFEGRCIRPEMEPEDRICIGLEILKEAWEANQTGSSN